MFEGLPVVIRLAPIYAYLMAHFVERERTGPFSFLERREDGSGRLPEADPISAL